MSWHITVESLHGWHITVQSLHGRSHHSPKSTWTDTSQSKVNTTWHIIVQGLHELTHHSLKSTWTITSQSKVHMDHYVTAQSLHDLTHYSPKSLWIDWLQSKVNIYFVIPLAFVSFVNNFMLTKANKHWTNLIHNWKYLPKKKPKLQKIFYNHTKTIISLQNWIKLICLQSVSLWSRHLLSCHSIIHWSGHLLSCHFLVLTFVVLSFLGLDICFLVIPWSGYLFSCHALV